MRKAFFSRERTPCRSPAATREVLHKPFLTLFHFVRISCFLVNTRFPVSGFSGSNSPCFALKQRIEQFTLEGRVQCSCHRFSKQSSSAKPHKNQRSDNAAASADALGKTQSQGIRSTAPPTVGSSSVYVTCTFKRADPTPSSTPVQRTAVPRTVTPPYLATGSRPNLGQQRVRVR